MIEVIDCAISVREVSVGSRGTVIIKSEIMDCECYLIFAPLAVSDCL